MIARGVLYPDVSRLIKEIYIDVAARDFRLDGKRVTDSRLSLLTGLQRRDIRSLRAISEIADREEPGGGYLPRVLARWQGDAAFCDSSGQPSTLPRIVASEEACFDSLVAAVSRDVHPRTILDELIRLGLVSFDPVSDTVALTANAFLPHRDEAALLRYFGDNLGDHALAAVVNLMAAPEAGPFFERAVHYNCLSPESLAALDQMARELQTEALSKLNAQALTLQDADTGNEVATGRFRSGAYAYFENKPTDIDRKDEET